MPQLWRSLPLGTLSSGTFKPTNYEAGVMYGLRLLLWHPGTSCLALSTFNGTIPNGTWKLFVFDDAGGDIGAYALGWCLTLTTGSVPTTTTTIASSLNPSFIGNNVTFTATVTSSGSPVNTGNVVFTEGLTTLAGPAYSWSMEAGRPHLVLQRLRKAGMRSPLLTRAMQVFQAVQVRLHKS